MDTYHLHYQNNKISWNRPNQGGDRPPQQKVQTLNEMETLTHGKAACSSISRITIVKIAILSKNSLQSQ